MNKNKKKNPIAIGWGTGMAITMLAFMAFIIVLAVKMSNIETNLVEKDYYEKGQNFDAIAEMKSNYNKEKGDVLSIWDNGEGALYFTFSETLDSGYVHLYRPSSRKLDFKVSCKGQKKVVVDVSKLLKGRWKAKVLFYKGGKGYLTEESIEI